MKLFATDEEVAQLEAQFSNTLSKTHIDIAMQLAWYIRQRDSHRSQKMVRELEDKLNLIAPYSLEEINQLDDTTRLSAQTAKRFQARLKLIQSEHHWLNIQIEEAYALAKTALAEFEALEDWIGCADTHWLLSWIYEDKGNRDMRRIELDNMQNAASKMNDATRVNIAKAGVTRLNAFKDINLISEQDIRYFTELTHDNDPICSMWSNECIMSIMYCKNDLNALMYLAQAYKKALTTGQFFYAIWISINAANFFQLNNEYKIALDWIKSSLDLSRQLNWPRAISMCLGIMSVNLRFIKNYSAAQEIVAETIQLSSPISKSVTYLNATNLQAGLLLDSKDYANALNSYQKIEEQALAIGSMEGLLEALEGQSKALAGLQKKEDAIDIAERGLRIAEQQNNAASQISFLTILYEIHHSNLSQSATDETAAINHGHYLLAALAIAEKNPTYLINSKLYELLGAEFARQKDPKQAYFYINKALIAKEREQDKEAFSRTNSMPLFHKIDQVKKESDVLRQQAQNESERAQELLKITETLEKLGAIGREITTHLDQDKIFEVLNGYVHSLLDVTSFGIYLVDESEHFLVLKYGFEDGKRYETEDVSIDDPTANSSKCYREQIDIIRNFVEGDSANHIPDTLRTQTALYLPLSIGTRRLGVMTVQSLKQFAYNQEQILIFKSIGAYAAIGLDNARTYQELESTRDHLVYKEKMAALGSIVAGVAHELNTPIGNGLLLATSLAEKSVDTNKKLASNTIRRSDLTSYVDACKEASYLITRSLQTAADLVMSFKQVSVDQTSAQRREFDLKQLIIDIVATLKNQFNHKNVALHIHANDSILMNSYPGPLGQVIMNLMQNALVHAFSETTKGNFTIITKRLENEHVLIEFIDDGSGIKPENIGKIFDPFFTTKLGSGGNGLGLNVSYNIVKSMLNGEIRVDSKVGAGTTFTLNLPLVALINNDEMQHA